MTSTTVSWTQLIFTFYYSHWIEDWIETIEKHRKARLHKDESEALRMRVLPVSAACVRVWAAGP